MEAWARPVWARSVGAAGKLAGALWGLALRTMRATKGRRYPPRRCSPTARREGGGAAPQY
eukprot:4502340-Prymnesium_polylepis.1